MKMVRLKSGGHVNILAKGEARLEGEICLSEREWELASKLGKNSVDPEAEREFWKTLIEKKQANPDYCLLTDFPDHQERVKSMAEQYCEDIKAMLRGRGAKTKAERESA